jgi:hypothetical protein
LSSGNNFHIEAKLFSVNGFVAGARLQREAAGRCENYFRPHPAASRFVSLRRIKAAPLVPHQVHAAMSSRLAA